MNIGFSVLETSEVDLVFKDSKNVTIEEYIKSKIQNGV